MTMLMILLALLIGYVPSAAEDATAGGRTPARIILDDQPGNTNGSTGAFGYEVKDCSWPEEC